MLVEELCPLFGIVLLGEEGGREGARDLGGGFREVFVVVEYFPQLFL